MPRDPIRDLVRVKGLLPDETHDAIVALGAAAVEPLLAIVRDRSTWNVDTPAEGEAPFRAVDLLVQLGDPRAVPVLVDALADSEPMEVFYSTLVYAIPEFGAAAVEPLLHAAATRTGDDVQEACADALSMCGVHDPRVLALLLEVLKTHPGLGASLLHRYGDPAALLALRTALMSPLPPDPFGPTEREIAETIVELGGELTPMEHSVVQQATRRIHEARDRALAERSPSAEVQPGNQTRRRRGRNERCWCGSGLKYKRCHYDADQALPANR